MTSAADRWPSAAEKLLKLLGVVAACWLCVDAGLSPPPRGLSGFGTPPDYPMVFWLLAVVAALAVAGAGDRRTLGRRLTLLLLLATLLDGRLVPAAPPLAAILAGVTLVVAAPYLRAALAPRVAGLVLLLSLPALFAGVHPHGGWIWLGDLLPALSTAVLLPALFDRDDVDRLVWVLLGPTALVALGAAASYLVLAEGLHVPLPELLSTRLRLLGSHPNLVVPHLVAALLLGTALAWSPRRRPRSMALVATLVVAGALVLVRSRTGALAAAGGVSLLAVLAIARGGGPRVLRLVGPLAAVGVVAALLLPAVGKLSPRPEMETGMVAKAQSFRASMWELGRATLQQAPPTGFGPHTFWVQGRFARSHRYDGLNKDDHPHNVVLAVGASLGWGGLAALALLLAASLRPPRHGDLVGLAASAALLAVWACNAVDMGGATSTLYPALAFPLLGLRDVVDASGRPERRPPTLRALGAVLLGAVSLMLGLALQFGGHDLDLAERTITAVEAGREGPDALQAARRALGRAGDVVPLDPRVAMLRARLARLEGKADETVAALADAARRMVGFAPLVHEQATALARSRPDDLAGQRALLEQAVALDPHGRRAWESLLGLAAVAARQGDDATSLAALADALVLHPGAAAEVPRLQGADGPVLRLAPDTGGIALSRLFAELDARRERLAPDDALAVRLTLRPIEIALALGELDQAEWLARKRLADQPTYLQLRLAATAAAGGRWDRAVALLDELGDHGHFHLHVDELTARSQAEVLDREGFEATLAEALDALPDVTFEPETVARMLDARRRVAERAGDAVTAVHMAEAAAFARD